MIQHEDGTGRTDAVSFGSVVDADAYHLARGNEAWTALAETAKEIGLVRATDWIGYTFAEEFVGVASFVNQALAFPRTGIVNPATGYMYDIGVMPKEILAATFELANEAAQGPLYSNVNPASAQIIEKTIGPLTTKYNPRNPLELTMERNFSYVRDILRPLLAANRRPLLTLARA